MRRGVALLALVMCGCKPGCEGGRAGPTGSASGGASVRGARAAAPDAFAFELYEAVRAGQKNFVVAPGPVTAALGVVHGGANGETANEIATALRLGTAKNPNEELMARAASLAASARPDVQFFVSNRLWIDKSVALTPAFQAHAVGGDAKVGVIDFASEPGASRNAANAYIAKQTHEKVSEAIWPSGVDDKTRLVVTTAVYFHPRWALPFDPAETKRLPFEFRMNAEGLAPMMRGTGTFAYADLDWLEILELPCAQGALSVVILLPKREQPFAALERGLASGKLAEWVGSAKPTLMDILIPKFQMTTHLGLATPLSGLGMVRAFGLDGDFSKLAAAPIGVGLSEVVTKVVIEVDEGVAAAPSAPAPGASPASSATDSKKPSTENPRFEAKRPFVFLVRDTRSGAVLIAGRYIQP